MKDLIEVLNKIIELLYQEEVKTAYNFLIRCLPIMSGYISDMEDQDLQKEIMGSLEEAVTAMENNDYTLLADIMQYDLIEKLEQIGEE
ncbi:MAG: hypothetical protein PUC12_05455 [Clostridiales bacterium]|nr:hypothetical protein [Clostridiales bacterium]